MAIQTYLLICGAVAGPLFIIVFFIEGALRPGYSAMRQAVSALSVGTRGWIQQANFIVVGLLFLAYAFGLRAVLQPYGASFWESFLVATYAVGLIGAGIFATDMVGAPRDPIARSKRTRAGIAHDIFSLLAFASVAINTFIFAHLFATSGSGAWSLYCIVSAICFVVGFVLFARGFAGASRLMSIAGLLQRLTITIGWLWASLLAIHLLGVL
jgi:hypothetical protein